MVLGAILGTIVHKAYAPEIPDDLDLGAARDAIEAEIKPTAAYQAFDGIATIFLKLLKMIVVPLVFFSLIGGMLGMGSLARLGRIGVKTFGLYVVTSLIAILTGLALVNLIRPGDGLDLTLPAHGLEKKVPESFWDVITNMIPDNVVRAAADFELIGVIIFSLFFGAFLLALTDDDKKQTMIRFVEAGGDIMMKMTHFIISLAPVGIGALIASMIAISGPALFLKLIWYVVTVVAALAAHWVITLPILVYVLTRRNVFRYYRAMLPAYLTGLSTASSSGTLGVTMERAENGAGVSNRVTSFVLPLGATINMDGTALYEIVSVLFIAQVHSAIDPAFTLEIGQQILIVFLGLVVSIGAAGIPHAGLVMMVIILQAVGLPTEYTALIWAVDRPLDMCRTATNIASDSCVALIVAHSEKDIDESVMWAPGEIGPS
jgi:Na+/H+-dicarboxylate symporter